MRNEENRGRGGRRGNKNRGSNTNRGKKGVGRGQSFTTDLPGQEVAKAPYGYKTAAASNPRYVIMLILVLLIQIDKAQSVEHTLTGYNCDHPTDHVLIPSPCLKVRNWDSNSQYSAWMAYKAKDRMIQGIRCVSELTLQSYYCGASSHIHLLDIPVKKVLALSPKECNQVYTSKEIKLYNRLYSVIPNTGMNHHGLMINGTLEYGYTLGVYNVFCNPSGIHTENHFVDYGFQTGMLSVSVTQVPLLLTDDNILDVQLDTVIGHWKNCTRGCTASTGSYYIPGDHTRYRLIKHLSFQKYSTGNRIFILNETENIHLEISKITTTKVSNRLEKILETELPGLVLFTNPDIQGKIPTLHAKEERYDISSFLNTLYKYKQVKLELDSQIQYEVCVKTHRLRILPSTHYTRGKSITSLGELLRISNCPQVNITITEGRKDKCYTNHITVQVNNVTKIMLPGSRVVFTISDIKPVPCRNHPVYLYIGNNTYLGNNGSGMNAIQVKQEKDHFKTHIFWSPLDDAFKSLTIQGENSVYTSEVTYLHDLKGTESILQTTSEQVTGLESLFDWTFGKDFTGKLKSYFWSVIGLIIIVAFVCSIFCFTTKYLCHKMYNFKFLPGEPAPNEN